MKSNKKNIKYFIIISIIIIGILPIINFSNFIKDYDSKKLFNTDKIETYVNYNFYKLFNRSMEKESVITGEDDFLFLGNKYARILHKTQGLYKYTNENIDNWTNKLKAIQTWYEDRGIKFVIVIAPNKHSIYKHRLPNWMKYNGKTITNDIVSYSKKKGINLLDLRDKLKEEKETQLYFTTDTHWNNKGASIGYQETIKYVNRTYDLKYKMPDYNLSISSRAGGDLANFLKIGSLLPKNYETNYSFIFNKESNVCHGNINKEHSLEKCENKKNPYMGINRQDQYMINSSSMNNDKLLLLCDSFGSANSKPYNETFNTIWKFHYGHINGNALSDFVSKKKPDIVIYQVVERDLYNGGIVKRLSNITVLDDSNENSIGNKIFDINNTKYEYDKNNQFSIDKQKLVVTHNDPIIILNKLSTNSRLVNLKYSLYSSVDTTFQLFYKEEVKDKYNENNSYRQVIKKGDNHISLFIPAKYINNRLRVDLVAKIGKYRINDFAIYEVK